MPAISYIVRRVVWCVGAVCVGSLVALIIAEIALRVTGLPRYPAPRQTTDLFRGTTNPNTGEVRYRNIPSECIRFTYADNPRQYFNEQNQVDHFTNSDGFRGPEFNLDKPAKMVRLMFLGDSFTFGEGVWLKDTYAEMTVVNLRDRYKKSEPQIEGWNLGVGGYNTVQALETLEEFAWAGDPDIVVLGFVLNDAEPRLFRVHPTTGERIRRNVLEDEYLDPDPTKRPVLRTVQLLQQATMAGRTTERMLAHYRGLYSPLNRHWQDCRQSLRQLINQCVQRSIPCVVVMFPVLYELNKDYPFARIHEAVGREVTGAGGVFMDMLPLLKGRSAQELWVHVTDHHPNEFVHHLTARALTEEIARREWLTDCE